MRAAPLPRIAAMRLEDLLAGAAVQRIVGDPAVEISTLGYDSRKAGPGTLYFCVPGEKVDGHDFASQVVEAGAAALVVERQLEVDVPQVVVEFGSASFWDFV